jgi:hypothetical protein
LADLERLSSFRETRDFDDMADFVKPSRSGSAAVVSDRLQTPYSTDTNCLFHRFLEMFRESLGIGRRGREVQPDRQD